MQESARDPEMFAKLDDLVETITATSRSQHDQLCVFRQGLADHLVIDDWATPIIARGPRPEFEMEQVLPGADPDDPDSDPITESNDLKDAGDARAASRIRDLTAVHPPELAAARSQEHGALQYPVADAAETRAVPPRPAHAVRPTAA